MLAVIGSLAGLIKIRSSTTLVDDATFRLFYRWTTSLCFVACGLVATSDLVGEPIQCLMGSEEAPKPITTYCWVSSTFTINTTDGAGEFDQHDNTGNSITGIGTHDPEMHERRVHAYYQWVPFILFLMGSLFYLPHIIWKEVEGKRVDSLLQGLNVISMDDTADAKMTNIVKYLRASHGRLNNAYAYGYLCMQILNLTAVVSMMFLLERFFGGIFLDYGHTIVQYLNGHPDVDHNPMVYAFPRLAKCIFKQFGVSGSIESHDVLCLLPQNIMNEKIFLVLWFWFVILTTIVCVQIVYIIAMIAFPILRLKSLERSGRMIPSAHLEALVHRTDTGDCFLLMTLGKNLDAITFKNLLEQLIGSMGAEPDGKSEAPMALFSPNAPTYRHFNIDEEDPLEHKRRMEAADTRV